MGVAEDDGEGGAAPVDADLLQTDLDRVEAGGEVPGVFVAPDGDLRGAGDGGVAVTAADPGGAGVAVTAEATLAADAAGAMYGGLDVAEAMRLACQSGRLAYLSGRIPKKLYATASSPTEGVIARIGQ